MMLLKNQERANAALRRIEALNAEQQSIYRTALHRTVGLTHLERIRLNQINREIALAQDERNRARCGAPPAPPDYDPLLIPPIVENTFETGERGNRKTNEEEVREMRNLYLIDKLSATQIWREFPHLKESTVRDILKNRTWFDPTYVPRETIRGRQIRDVVSDRTSLRIIDS
jgi:hypothetical protein